MDDQDATPPPPEATAAPGPTGPRIRSEEALARSKEQVPTSFKEPRAPKSSGRWAAGRTIGRRPLR